MQGKAPREEPPAGLRVEATQVMMVATMREVIAAYSGADTNDLWEVLRERIELSMFSMIDDARNEDGNPMNKRFYNHMEAQAGRLVDLVFQGTPPTMSELRRSARRRPVIGNDVPRKKPKDT